MIKYLVGHAVRTVFPTTVDFRLSENLYGRDFP